jgi:small subunit ribosomal protein S1
MSEPTPPPPPETPRPSPAAPGKPPMAERVAARREAYKPGKPPALDKEEVTLERPRLRQLDAEIEAELEAAMAGLDQKSLLSEPGKEQRQPRRGDAAQRQTGKVMRVHQGDVFVEMPGGRSQGLLQTTQFPDGPPKVGDVVEFHIERYDPANGLFILTREGQAVAADWSTVQIGQVVEARVTDVNKGGLSVDVNGIRGFLPISQIDLYRVEQPEQFVNQKLLCMIAEVSPEERNLVVSRRALLEREKQEKSEQTWAEVKEGQIRKGVVRSVKPFGAFVDVGGIDGLVPVGEMAWKRINDPSEIVQPGQAVEVAVIRVDREARKLTLSLRDLVASPWDKASANYLPRTLAKGVVTRTEQFGAFVELEPGIEGLIHVSELAPQRVFNVLNVVKPGQEVEVMVLNVDADKKRMSLSLKQAQQAKAPPPAPTPTKPEEADEGAAPAKARKHNFQLRGGTGPAGPLFPNLPNREGKPVIQLGRIPTSDSALPARAP